MVHNGAGAVDWSGLPVAVELYGVQDVEGLIERLLMIKGHKPPKKE